MYTWGSMSKMMVLGDKCEKKPNLSPKQFLINVIEDQKNKMIYGYPWKKKWGDLKERKVESSE